MSDFRVAFRSLIRAPGFSLAVILTLALGIGATTAIFSVVDGVLLRPAPLADIGRLGLVWETDRKSGTTREPASVPDYLDFQARSRQLAGLAAFNAVEVNFTPAAADPTRLAAMQVSHEFLPLIGIQPLLGRSFTAEDDRPGGSAVAMISEELWRKVFDRDPGVLGRSIRIDDRDRTIIGVMPPAAGFGMLQVLADADYGRAFADRGDRVQVDAWFPLAPDPVATPRYTHPIFVLGQLASGATFGSVQQELAGVAADLEHAYSENDGRGVFIEPLSTVVFARVRPALLVLLGAVAVVLLVACVNVANLLLVRGAARARDVTVRAALGAGFGHLARHFLAESVLLTVAGAGLGIYLATGGLALLLALAPATIPRIGDVRLDYQVLAVTLTVSVLVALVFGLLPLLQARRAARSLVGASRTTGGRDEGRVRASLVVAELALAVMLMAGAGLLIRSLWSLQQVDPGFRPAGVLKADFQLPPGRYPADYSKFPVWPEIQRFTGELRRQAAALPGVETVSVAAEHPLEGGFTSSISVVGREAEAGDWPEPSIRRVDAGYFTTLDVPLLSGRRFGEGDDASGHPVIVINEAARRRYFQGSDPLGQQISLWGAHRTVIGVVADERFHGLDAAAAPAVYLPLAQAPSANGSILVRVKGDPAAVAPAVRAIVHDLDPTLPLFGVEPLRQTIADSLGQRRFAFIVLGAFAAVALLLAVVGVHGVLSYSVARRSREIGIRIALGADLARVRQLVLHQGLRLTALGLAIGLGGGLLVTRVLRSMLYGVSPSDPLTFAGVGVLLGAVAVLAAWLPARRAARVDPMAVLKSE